MKIAAICFTLQGQEVLRKLKQSGLSDPALQLYCRGSAFAKEEDVPASGFTAVTESVADWAARRFEEKNALLFVGAAGIAVRAVAPLVKDKLTDAPVLVMDDGGRYVIPLLSGHVGGANELARLLAEKTGAEPVITTSTDVHGKFAVDVFAKKNGLRIRNREGIAAVSAKLLQGEEITLAVSEGIGIDRASLEEFQVRHPGEIRLVTEGAADVRIVRPKETGGCAALVLEKKEYILGIGCRKGKEADALRAFVQKKLSAQKISMEEVSCIASIDCKKEEAGLVCLAKSGDIPFVTYSAEALAAVEGDFTESEFVRRQVGVGNVSERAAMAACAQTGRLILPKQAEDGMTLAIVRDERKLRF